MKHLISILLIATACTSLKEIRQDMRNSKSTIHLNNHVKEAQYNTNFIACFINTKNQ